MQRLLRAILLCLFGITFLIPYAAFAVDTESDQQCVESGCSMSKTLGHPLCSDVTCTDITGGNVTTGKCITPNKCLATKTDGKTPDQPDETPPSRLNNQNQAELKPLPSTQLPQSSGYESQTILTTPVGTAAVTGQAILLNSLNQPTESSAVNTSGMPQVDSQAAFREYLQQTATLPPDYREGTPANIHANDTPKVGGSDSMQLQPGAVPGTLIDQSAGNNPLSQNVVTTGFGSQTNPNTAPWYESVIEKTVVALETGYESARDFVANTSASAYKGISEILGESPSSVTSTESSGPVIQNVVVQTMPQLDNLRDPAQALTEAAYTFCPAKGCDPVLTAQALTAVCMQESQCDPKNVTGSYVGIGQLNATETRNALTTIQNLANNDALSPEQKATAQRVADAINDEFAAGRNPNKDPYLGSWLLAARQVEMPEMGKVSPLSVASTYADTPQQAAAIMQMAQLAPSTIGNQNEPFNPDRDLTQSEIKALKSNAVPVSTGDTVSDALDKMMASKIYANNFEKGISLAEQFTTNSPASVPVVAQLNANTLAENAGNALIAIHNFYSPESAYSDRSFTSAPAQGDTALADATPSTPPQQMAQASFGRDVVAVQSAEPPLSTEGISHQSSPAAGDAELVAIHIDNPPAAADVPVAAADETGMPSIVQASYDLSHQTSVAEQASQASIGDWYHGFSWEEPSAVTEIRALRADGTIDTGKVTTTAEPPPARVADAVTIPENAKIDMVSVWQNPLPFDVAKNVESTERAYPPDTADVAHVPPQERPNQQSPLNTEVAGEVGNAVQQSDSVSKSFVEAPQTSAILSFTDQALASMQVAAVTPTMSPDDFGIIQFELCGENCHDNPFDAHTPAVTVDTGPRLAADISTSASESADAANVGIPSKDTASSRPISVATVDTHEAPATTLSTPLQALPVVPVRYEEPSVLPPTKADSSALTTPNTADAVDTTAPTKTKSTDTGNSASRTVDSEAGAGNSTRTAGEAAGKGGVVRNGADSGAGDSSSAVIGGVIQSIMKLLALFWGQNQSQNQDQQNATLPTISLIPASYSVQSGKTVQFSWTSAHWKNPAGIVCTLKDAKGTIIGTGGTAGSAQSPVLTATSIFALYCASAQDTQISVPATITVQK